MKRFLVHFANLAVMIHMAFGCFWHHGFAATCTHDAVHVECLETATTVKPDASDCCNSPAHSAEDSENHVPENGVLQKEDTYPVANSPLDHGHDHLGCCDDGCNALITSEFNVQSFHFVSLNAWIAVVPSVVMEIKVGRDTRPEFLPTNARLAPKVRSHLAKSVQLV